MMTPIEPVATFVCLECRRDDLDHALPKSARQIDPGLKSLELLVQFGLVEGDLDLTALKFDLANPTNFSKWVLVHDRVADGEMPPKKKARPERTEQETFLKSLSASLTTVEQARIAKEGRATQRRSS